MKMKYAIGTLLFHAFAKWVQLNKIPYVAAMDVRDDGTDTIVGAAGYDNRVEEILNGMLEMTKGK